MAFPVWPLLFLLHIPLAWAGPLSTVSLTPDLAKVIPSCAQSCVKSFVAEEYKTVCGPPPNFDCLCVNNTPSGFTIGEISLECLVSSCQDVQESVLASVYAVCISVPNARPNTHTIITATRPSVTSSTSTASSTNSNGNISSSTFSSKDHTTFSTSTSASSVASRSQSTIATRTSSSSQHSSSLSTTNTPFIIPTISSTPSTKATAAAASTSAAAAAPILTKPQIAGVVVASLGAVALAFGLCFFLFCLRKRKSKRRYSESSFGGKNIGESEDSSPDMANIAARDFGRDPQPREEPPAMPPPMPRGPLRLVTPATSSEDGWEDYQRTMTKDNIGKAVESPIPTATAEHSPNTPKSNRTTDSQLLPDKPRYSLFPSPLRIHPQNSNSAQGSQPSGKPTSPQAPRSAGPPPQFPNAMDNTSQVNLQGRSGPSRTLSDPFYDPRNRTPPHIHPYVQASHPASPHAEYPEHPAFRLSTQVEPTGRAARNPVPPQQSPSARFLYPSSYLTQHPNLPRAQPSSGPGDYTAVLDKSRRRKSHSKNKSESHRPLTGETYFSDTGSETSFENSESEDDRDTRHRSSRPTRPGSNLSPVTESPRKLGSPFQHQQDRFQYPPVPVATTASPMRYPGQLAYPESLSSRRLGEQRAREIAGRLDTQQQPSAKWKVLVSPGLEPLDSPSSPSPRGDGRTPPFRR